MTPLIVSAFFDIGRGTWKDFQRPSDFYVDCYKAYPAKLPGKRYLLAPQSLRPTVESFVDHFDAAAPADLKAFAYLDRTREVMASDRFKSLFDGIAPEPPNPEYRSPDYNVVVLAKWDALERAHALTGGRHSHYVWLDFGLGRRGGAGKKPYLPKPRGLSPIDRDRIVISADRDGGLPDLGAGTLAEQVRSFRDQVATSMMIVPSDKVPTFCALARGCYELLLENDLASDDQVVVDMCVARAPHLFHLAHAPAGLTKYNHIHNVLNGADRDDRPASGLRRLFARPIERAKIGLPIEFRLR